jgi:putative peptidoglycan lipid II flippase
MTSRSLGRAAVRMGGATAAARGLGFVRVLVIAAVLGTTFLGNTFQAANSVSNVLFELLAAGALSAVLVPTFVTLLDRGDDAEARRLASGLLGVALAILVPITIVAMASAPWIADLLSTGAPAGPIAKAQQDLATFLLVFFLPQLPLYAIGAIATACLYARRTFAVTAAAPIASSIVIIGAMIVFRVVAGDQPTLDLNTGDKVVLAIAGTGGVLGFVGVLVVAARNQGFTLRPRWLGRDPELAQLVRHSGWGVLLHTNAGLLLGAALVLGNAVAGGVLAYQVAFVFFLAPYAVFAQPIHTVVLPELAGVAITRDEDAFASSLRWAVDHMALVLVPVTAGLVALSLPLMRVVTFGRASESGPDLIAAGLAALSVGLLPYGAFLLFARGFYARGDSRTPAYVAIATALVGVATMVVLASMTDGAARVAALGAGHSAAYLAGAVVLGALLARRSGAVVWPRHLPVACAVAGPLAVAAWAAFQVVDPSTRFGTAALLLLTGGAGTAAYLAFLRRWWRTSTIAQPLVEA